MKNKDFPMKNRCIFSAAAIAFLILCFCVTGAFAENRAGAITVTAFEGGFNFDSNLPYDNGWTWGLGLGYNFSEKLSAELAYNYIITLAIKYI
jgi:long-subunit fatty acid transport protein